MGFFSGPRVDPAAKTPLSAEEFPLSSVAEMKRFQEEFSTLQESRRRLHEYLEFRRMYELDQWEDPEYLKRLKAKFGVVLNEEDPFKEDWDLCFHVAMESVKENRHLETFLSSSTTTASPSPQQQQQQQQLRQSPTTTTTTTTRSWTIPDQYLYTYKRATGEYAKCKKGEIVVHIVPARINLEEVNSETHALAMTLLMILNLSRLEEQDRVHMVVDIRRGEGWPNIKAPRLIPLARTVNKWFPSFFPGRITSCLAYPIPGPAMILYYIFKGLIPKHNRDKLQVVAGCDHPLSPPPKDILLYMDQDVVDAMEARRQELKS